MTSLDPPAGPLWSRAAAGDREAFAELYLRNSDRVYTHCYRRTLSQHDAEDLTAEVFTRTWARRQEIRLGSDGEVIAWLLATANNLLLQRGGSRTRSSSLMERLRAESGSWDNAAREAEAAQDDENLRRVHLVIDQLQPADREVIWMCVVEGVSPTDYATVTRQRPGTVRSRLTRALRRARALHRELFPSSDPSNGDPS